MNNWPSPNPSPAYLLASQPIDEEQRHRNEVKLVAGLETHARRSWYIEGEGGVRDRRGDAIADRLRRDVWEFMKGKGAAVEPQQDNLFAGA